MVNYTKGSDELREAWFEYKRAHPNDKFLHVADFAAGWNAAQQSVHLTALRRGLAVSIFINVVLLAVVLATIGGR